MGVEPSAASDFAVFYVTSVRLRLQESHKRSKRFCPSGEILRFAVCVG